MINPQVSMDALEHQAAFMKAVPYRHIAIDNFLTPDACEALLRDFPKFDPAKAKNEHGEIGGKAVNEAVSGISPFYSDFYNYINSSAFLNAISDLTGIPDLIADPTLYGGGTHNNMNGQDLDPHIDFNIDEQRYLHRRINLLVYLNKEWDASWGGAIQLHSDPTRPEVDEVKSFLPLFNRAVIFETNEVSWHGFPQIKLPEDKKSLSRKSFSIYLYTKTRPVEEAVAPHTTFYVSRPLPTHISPGRALNADDAQAIQIAVVRRDGLIRMYHKLLIEKEQRLQNFMHNHQADAAEFHAVANSRTWRWALAVHRFKYKVTHIFS